MIAPYEGPAMPRATVVLTSAPGVSLSLPPRPALAGCVDWDAASYRHLLGVASVMDAEFSAIFGGRALP